MKIGNLDVSNTSGRDGRMDKVTVYRDRQVIAQIVMRKRNPLGYLRKYPNGEHASNMRRQLVQAGVDEGQISLILTPPDGHVDRLQKSAIPSDMLSMVWFSLPTGVKKDDNAGHDT